MYTYVDVSVLCVTTDVVMCVPGLWLLSDFNRCSNVDDKNAMLVEREKVIMSHMLLSLFNQLLSGYIATRFVIGPLTLPLNWD